MMTREEQIRKTNEDYKEAAHRYMLARAQNDESRMAKAAEDWEKAVDERWRLGAALLAAWEETYSATTQE